VLDAAGASFVSITQAFNTTTSMGRLTLNVLLSFAQFEREVICERVRDKVAASKRKGMWMGGPVPLGYDLKERKLIINAAEAETVRHILRRYIALAPVRAPMAELEQAGIRSKLHCSEDGSRRGGMPFTRGALYTILANRTYIGEVAHKGAVYPGEHDAIVERTLWDEVQQRLASNRVERRHQTRASGPSLLAGMMSDGEGRRMTPSHASKAGVRYRYYVLVDEAAGPKPRPIRVAAGDIEPAIIASIIRLLSDRAMLLTRFQPRLASAAQTEALFKTAAGLIESLRASPPSALHAHLVTMDLGVVVYEGKIEASVDLVHLGRALGSTSDESASEGGRIQLDVPTILVQRGKQVRLTILGKTQVTGGRRDSKLVELIVRAHDSSRRLGLFGDPAGDEPGEVEKAKVFRLARFSFLAPDIVSAILEGRQPPTLQTRRLLRIAALPACWSEQRRMLGFR
jgi:hypothetical protein